MKYIITLLWVLLLCSTANANVLTWVDNSNNETGFAIEMLDQGAFKEVARVAANITTYTDSFTEGVYKVRAFISIPGSPDVFSAYTNTAAKLNAPVNLNIQ